MKTRSKSIITIICIPFLFFRAQSQTDALGFFQNKLDTYNKTLLPEKLFVHTDKNFYSAGDLLWFRIYSLDGFLNKPLSLSKVGYVEILNKDNVPVAQVKVNMDDQGGNGSIQLPLNLKTGSYTLRSYTNWMKNSGAEHFFHKQILLFNPFKNNEQQTRDVTLPVLNLFPEGGNLVYGLPSKVAYHLSAPDGKGLTAKGFLINEQNDTLSVFSPKKFGMGSFDLTPQQGRTYKVVFIFDDNSIVMKPITQVYDKGFVMAVEEDDKERLLVTVRSNVLSGYPEIYFVADNRQIIKAAKRNVLANGVVSFLINKSDLGEGVSRLTIFNNERQPVCERLFFIQPSEKAKATIAASGSQFGLREKISLSISSPEKTASVASLAVYQTDSFQTRNETDIVSFLWLNSELKGFIENPDYYLSADNADIKTSTDLLMLTHGWRRFSWEKMLNQPPAFEYPAENSGQKISARVVDSRNGKSAGGVQVYLTIPETKQKLYTGISNSEGLVSIDVKDFYGAGKMILQTDSQKDSVYRIELVSPFSQQFLPTGHSSLQLDSQHRSLLESYSVSMQAQHIYSEDSLKQFVLPEIKDTFSFWGNLAAQYKLDSYSRFTTMEEVLREYVREINVGAKGGGNLSFKIFNENDREFYTKNILVVVDGVPLFNPNRIFSFDPLKIRQLDVITNNYILGPTVFHAMASFSSYQGNYEDLELDNQAIVVDYEGLQLKREFYAPEYQSAERKQSRIPDLRTTLYWSGNIALDKPASFYSGDNKGKFLAVLQGISADGIPFSARASFEVK